MRPSFGYLYAPPDVPLGNASNAAESSSPPSVDQSKTMTRMPTQMLESIPYCRLFRGKALPL